MVTVYIVTRELEYDGLDILGVYSTRERAEEAKKNYKLINQGYYAGATYDIKTYTMND